MPASDDSRERVYMGHTRIDHSGWIQHARWKKNIEYHTPDNKVFFAKYCKRQNGRIDTVAGLVNEKKILELLQTTGITPSVGEIKLYPNNDHPTRARLLLEKIPGLDLNNKEIGSKSDFVKHNANEVLLKSAKAYETIHAKNVLQVDVNPGNILLSIDGNGAIQIRLIDFELAIDLNSSDESEKQRCLRWYGDRDNSGALDEVMEPVSDILKAAEVGEWARMMCEWMLGPSYLWKNTELPQVEELTSKQRALLSIVTERVKSRAEARYKGAASFGNGLSNRTVEDEIKYSLERTLPHMYAQANLSETLEGRLLQRGVSINPSLLEFLKSALSPDISDRPKDFHTLLDSY